MNKKISTGVAVGIIIIISIIVGGYFLFEYKINNADVNNNLLSQKTKQDPKTKDITGENLMQINSFEKCVENNGFKTGASFPGICYYEYEKGQYKVFVEQSVCGNHKCESVNCEERGIDKIDCPVPENIKNVLLTAKKKLL